LKRSREGYRLAWKEECRGMGEVREVREERKDRPEIGWNGAWEEVVMIAVCLLCRLWGRGWW